MDLRLIFRQGVWRTQSNLIQCRCGLRDEDFLDVPLVPFHTVEICRISNSSGSRAELLVQSLQALATEDAAVGEHHRIVLDVALGVVRVGHISGKLVELGATDRADGRTSVGICLQRILRVAARRLECREARRQGDVEEWLGRQGVELVVGLNELASEVIIPLRTVHCL